MAVDVVREDREPAGATWTARRILKRWLIGYLLVLFGTLPLALPCWNRWLVNRIGRVVTIEQVHVAQYLLLGWLAALYVEATSASRRIRPWLAVLLLVGIAGLLDELVQGRLPQRVFDWADVFLDWSSGVLGIFLGAASRWCGSTPGEAS